MASLLAGAVLLAGAAAPQDPEPVTRAARQIQWSPANSEALHRLFGDARVVTRFLNEIDATGDPADTGVFASVSEYRIRDVNGDGVLELVALADVSGRAFFNNLVIVYQTYSLAAPKKPLDTEFDGFRLRSVHGFHIESLDDALKDLDTDGVYEVVVNGMLGPEQARTKPQPMLPEIYKWNGQDYENASPRYAWYYQQVVLPALERELQKLERLPAPAEASERIELRARRDKVAREIAEARKRAAER